MTLQDWLAARTDRCPAGFAPAQHPALCHCRDVAVAPRSEWAIFRAALRESAGPDGLIHQTDMRPRIQAIPHKHRGSLYLKAKKVGLIEFAGKEPSTDAAGKNTDKDQKVWKLRGAA